MFPGLRPPTRSYATPPPALAASFHHIAPAPANSPTFQQIDKPKSWQVGKRPPYNAGGAPERNVVSSLHPAPAAALARQQQSTKNREGESPAPPYRG